MDNASKALYMAVGVLLFIVALTSSLFLYSRIIDFANVSLVISDMGDRAEFSRNLESSSTREIKSAEVVTSIIQINKLDVKGIKVNCESGNYTYTPLYEGYMKISGRSNEQQIRGYDFSVITNGTYKMTYDSTNNLINYKLIKKEGG